MGPNEKDDTNMSPVNEGVQGAIGTAPLQGEYECSYPSETFLQRMPWLWVIFDPEYLSDRACFVLF